MGLYYQVTRQAAAAKQAIDGRYGWRARRSDLRQLALVFDWCGPAMTPAQSDRLAAKIERGSGATPATDVRGQSARVFAAIALADRLPDQGNAILSEIVQKWWRAQIVPQLAAGRNPPFRANNVSPVRDAARAARQRQDRFARIGRRLFQGASAGRT